MKWSTAEKVNAGFAAALGIVTIIGVASITSSQRFAATTRDLNETHSTLTALRTVLANLDEVAAARRENGTEVAAERVRTARGREIMDSIRVLARDLEHAEIERLAAYNRRATVNARIAAAIIGGGGFFAFIVVLASGALIRRGYSGRRRAELALRDSETLLSQFMENLPIGVIVVDAHGRPRFANNAAVDILGTGILIDDGSHPFPLYRADDQRVYPTDRTPLALALAGQTSSIDDAQIRVGSRYVPIEVSAAPIYDASGRIAYAIAAFSDVTERRRAEDALRAARDEAEAAGRTRSDFLARMSHELRTPLNSVIGFANVLLKRSADTRREQEVACLERIRDNGTHLLHLIDDILDLSKIEAGRIRVDTTTVDLRELITDVAHRFERQARDAPVRLQVHVPERLRPVQSDPARLRQVLTNLIGSAAKFVERGSITIGVEADERTARPLRIRVSDIGIGMPENRLEAIFDAFEQAGNSTSRTYGGTGLGLPISRALCELMGYSLTVRSRVGGGSEFTIDMSAARRSPAAADRRAIAETAGRSPA